MRNYRELYFSKTIFDSRTATLHLVSARCFIYTVTVSVNEFFSVLVGIEHTLHTSNLRYIKLPNQFCTNEQLKSQLSTIKLLLWRGPSHT